MQATGNITIRMASASDADRVIEMGSRSIAIGPYKNDLKDAPDVTMRLYRLLIDNPMARIIVSEEEGKVTGILALLLFNHYYSGELTAGEIIWYVEPEYRQSPTALELYWKACQLAKEAGATRMQMTAPDPAVGQAYVRLGFHEVETTYQRDL